MSADPFVIHHEAHVLYEDHHCWLQGWLRRRLGNAADAADLAHDAFLRLILKPDPKGYDRASACGACTAAARVAENSGHEPTATGRLATSPERIPVRDAGRR